MNIILWVALLLILYFVFYIWIVYYFSCPFKRRKQSIVIPNDYILTKVRNKRIRRKITRMPYISAYLSERIGKENKKYGL